MWFSRIMCGKNAFSDFLVTDISGSYAFFFFQQFKHFLDALLADHLVFVADSLVPLPL